MLKAAGTGARIMAQFSGHPSGSGSRGHLLKSLQILEMNNQSSGVDLLRPYDQYRI